MRLLEWMGGVLNGLALLHGRRNGIEKSLHKKLLQWIIVNIFKKNCKEICYLILFNI